MVNMMTQTAGTVAQRSVSGLMGPPRGDLTLRIAGTERNGQVVRLAAAKCAVGSAPNCTLRLRAIGVRPLHCLILRGEGGTTVRRWSPDTRLNGRTFTDALLQPGDRLGIGPIEFEVLDDTPHDEARELKAGGTERPQADAIDNRLRQACQQGQQRVVKMKSTLLGAENQIADLESQTTRQSERTKSLHERVEELDTKLSDFEMQRAIAEAERRAAVGEVNHLAATVQRMREKLDDRRQANARKQDPKSTEPS